VQHKLMLGEQRIPPTHHLRQLLLHQLLLQQPQPTHAGP
jgi:hypothetical protein